MTKKKKHIKLIIILLLVVLTAFIARSFYYAYNTGSRSGRVTDPNGNPIEGAVVVIAWVLKSFGTDICAPGAYYETVTDKEGKYYIPNQKIKRSILLDARRPEKIFAYKDGYLMGYSVEIDNEIRMKSSQRNECYDYRKHNNKIILFPWDSKVSHSNHYGHISNLLTFIGRGDLLKKALQNEEKRYWAELKSRKRKSNSKPRHGT